jgi:hypothetical protein
MKKSLFLSFAVLAAFSAHAATPETVPAPISHVYVPTGFDDNDDAEIVVSGYLPNLCYKSAKAQARVTGRTIRVTVTAYRDPLVTICPQMVVPYLATASVGVLPRGSYRVVTNDNTVSRLNVAEAAGTAIDDHVYANVEFVQRRFGNRRILLKGYNPSDCFELDRVEFLSNRADTFSVLPIMKQTRASCPRKMTPFTIATEVPTGLDGAEILLHVRALGGKSVNALFTNIELEVSDNR